MEKLKEKMKYCKNCNNMMEDDEIYCSNCGTK